MSWVQIIPIQVGIALLLLTILSLKVHVKIAYGFFGGVVVGILSVLITRSIFFLGWKPQGIGFIIYSVVVILVVTIILILCRFYRDPERSCNEKEHYLVSPADGTVRYVKKSPAGETPVGIKKGRILPYTEMSSSGIISGDIWHIGIEMSVLDVHVNRAPMSGQINDIIRLPGKFLSLRDLRSLHENERVCTIIKGSTITVIVIQIASRLVRRIKIWKRKGDRVKRCERIGMITFGSQVDILLPENTRIIAKEGDTVKAGKTVVAVVENVPESA